MAREFAGGFYKSKSWKNTRRAYYELRHGLCERCLRNGVLSQGAIVHHKIHLTPANINDPAVSLSFSNLELLCRECHAKEHAERKAAAEPRVSFDAEGNIVRRGMDGLQ